MEIKKLNKEEVWDIRHRVLWPDRDRAYIQLEDDDEGIHLGLFVEDKLATVISLFLKDDVAQFRKFATLQEEQGKGYGSTLLEYALKEASLLGAKSIWCNARKNKTYFYSRFGLVEKGGVLEKGGQQYIIMEKIYD
ncbi:MAG: family acetyltransferase [Anaerosolibacter sp.]|uniref:GNAT family N-acetyltransferase n=1 Tax=Anaerosolibacter sp. TaxID=1872527 RepID=UPI002626C7C0|nr:GNAT family N-acetyltransferase [Anaerosolibacter sp.]MDF2547543.1 family acetyltransferase [Anaerosolibacter sp.]